MIDEPESGRSARVPESRMRRIWKRLTGELAWELVIAGAIALLVLLPLPSIDLPSIPTPDLPDIDLPALPDWLAGALKWGKYALLVGIGIALAIAAIRRRSDADGHPDPEEA